MNIELRHLRYFVAVAEEASFTAAAHRVHVAQQALSTQIRQLEDAVGTRLLDRTNKGAALTPAWAAASPPRGTPPARSPARCRSGSAPAARTRPGRGCSVTSSGRTRMSR